MAGTDDRPAGHLVHGTGREPVAATWPPLQAAEVGDLLAGYDLPGPVAVRWRSPRPNSAAALVDAGGRQLFVKRHATAVRDPAALGEEHRFLAHLRVHGVPVPGVLTDRAGRGAVARGGWTYEVHEQADGVDLYRDDPSWTPFRSAGHAATAGAALARFHLAAAGYGAPARPQRPLLTRFGLLTAADPLGLIEARMVAEPALAEGLAGRPWRSDLRRWHLPAGRRLAPVLEGLPALWTHGDWHPSNLLWSDAGADAAVQAVLDVGLADRTAAVIDVATALERSAIGWLEPGPGRPVDLAAAAALLAGYEQIRPMTEAESSALPLLLPVVHTDFALSEVEYFAGIARSPADADAAYDYLVGHAAWFAEPPARPLLDLLETRGWRRERG